MKSDMNDSLNDEQSDSKTNSCSDNRNESKSDEKNQERSLEQSFNEVYLKFKLQLFQAILHRLGSREASLTTVETFCIDIIHSLGTPTISEFAKFVNISQANATYKVQSLEKKGYLTRIQSKKDKREWQLHVTSRYYDYTNPNSDYVVEVVSRLRERLTPEQQRLIRDNLNLIADELMPEVKVGKVSEAAECVNNNAHDDKTHDDKTHDDKTHDNNASYS
ncbi:MAG: MarR family transcriptional regulator [Coriobacteriales bacterium]|jgi:DNA-binding MarR family transcriptional regulator|nr:MarR family transcriptional regulator [Coriobacteriales bacterium]